MGLETALIVGASAGLAQTGLTVYQSMQQAQYHRDVRKAQGRAAGIQAQQVRAQEALEREQASRRAQQVRGRIRAAAGESGLGFGGTYDAFMRQTDYEELTNRMILGQSAENAIQAIFSGIQPMPKSNLMLDAAVGVLGGLQTGLGMTSGIMQLGTAYQKAPGTSPRGNSLNPRGVGNV